MEYHIDPSTLDAYQIYNSPEELAAIVVERATKRLPLTSAMALMVALREDNLGEFTRVLWAELQGGDDAATCTLFPCYCALVRITGERPHENN